MKTYTDKHGNTVFTSEFLRSRGTCCKSGCLHCPFGFSLNKFGLELKSIENDKEDAIAIYSLYFKKDSVTQSLLGSAFKTTEAKDPELNNENFKLLTLKDVSCGLVQVENGQFKKLYLAEHFDNQGIDDARVRALFE